MKAYGPTNGWGTKRRGCVEDITTALGGLKLGGRPRSNLDLNLDEVAAGKPIVLFDINGSLLHRESVRGSAGTLTMRPGLEAIARLMDHFNLGLYTSAAPRTVTSILPELDDHIDQERDVSEGGKPWDTIKPLGKWFKKLDKVVLVDSDPFKAVPGEESNLLFMPAWQKGDMDDDLLPRLVDLLLQYRVRMTDGDVRDYTAEITGALVAACVDPAIIDDDSSSEDDP